MFSVCQCQMQKFPGSFPANSSSSRISLVFFPYPSLFFLNEFIKREKVYSSQTSGSCLESARLCRLTVYSLAVQKLSLFNFFFFLLSDESLIRYREGEEEKGKKGTEIKKPLSRRVSHFNTQFSEEKKNPKCIFDIEL